LQIFASETTTAWGPSIAFDTDLIPQLFSEKYTISLDKKTKLGTMWSKVVEGGQDGHRIELRRAK